VSYCDIAPGHPFHGPYHEREHGFPVADDAVLFERLVLEMNQAGLSWLTVLKKRDAFRRAFADYDVERVARFTDARRAKLMGDAGIIRNRLKIAAVVENAKRIRSLQREHGSFAAWLGAQPPLAKAEWVKLFKKTFVFTGGEITGEFLMSIGYLPGAHEERCPVYARALRMRPRWAA
jgi:DNA-3-methyladenine glycosylase I